MITRHIIGFAFTLAIATSATACICHADFNEQTFAGSLKRYDFIALVQVKTVRVYDYKNPYYDRDKPDYATIEILELFKGEKTDSLQVWGIGTSCEMGVKPNSTWIMYGFGQNGKYSVQSCTYSHVVNLNEKEDRPFNTTSLYQLKEIFDHPVPVLKNGVHEEFFPSGALKSRFTVENKKLEGALYYKSNSGHISIANYHQGKLHGSSYEMLYGTRLIYITNYDNDSLSEKVHYRLEPYDSSLYDLATSKGLETLLLLPKIKHYQYQVFADKSTLVKLWTLKGQLSSVTQSNEKRQTVFHIIYYETGEINGSGIMGQDGIYTYTGYYKSGTIERKLTSGADRKTTTIVYYNTDGSIKNQNAPSD